MDKTVACVILDWKRPFNMEEVLQGIQSQSLRPTIYVVHVDNDRKYEGCININIEANYGPGIKFGIMSIIPEPYTVVVDDDIAVTDPGYIKLMYESCISKNYVGAVGVLLGPDPDKPYRSGGKVYAPEMDTPVDIILANLFMIKTEMANRLWNQSLPTIRELQYRHYGFITNEDCIMGFLWKQSGLNSPYAVGTGERPYKVLDVRFGLENDPDHYIQRDRTCRYFLNK